MTTHYEKIQALGNRMASNLETMGVSASFGDGGLTLADKILEIQHFTDGLLLWADKDIIQTGDIVNFCALLLEDKKAVSGETILFRGLETTQTLVANTETTVNNCYKLTNVTLSGSDRIYLNEEQSIYLYIAGGSLMLYDRGSRYLTIRNEIISVENGIITVYERDIGTKLTVDATSTNTNKITSTISDVIIAETMQGTTGSNGVATVSYTGKGAGVLNIKAVHGIFQSETYELFDCMFYDKAVTGYKNTNWLNVSNNFLETIEDDGTILTYNRTSGWAVIYANSNSTSTFPFSIGSVVEFDVISCTGEVRIQLYDGTNMRYQFSLPTNTTDYNVKIEIGASLITKTVNGVTSSESISSYGLQTFQCVFATSVSGANLKFKNFVVYPI